MTGVEHLTIAADEAEQRLDRWFRKRFPHVSQGRIEKMCRKGEIRVDGGRVKAATRVAPGQVVRVPPLPADEAPLPVPPPAATPEPDAEAARALRDAVLFRDDHLIVLNKPAGLAVQGGTGQRGTGQRSHLGALLPALRFGRPDDPRLVHRLDKDTSGLLVLARTPAAAAKLGALFRSREVEKIYVAAVAGKPEPPAGTIRFGLVKAGGGRDGTGDERMRTLHPDEVAATRARGAPSPTIASSSRPAPASPPWRSGPSPAARTSCAPTWPPLAARSPATANMAAAARRTRAKAGAPASAARSAASCTCTPRASPSRTPPRAAR